MNPTARLVTVYIFIDVADVICKHPVPALEFPLKIPETTADVCE